MAQKCFGEFMGTLVLVLLGDGVVANVLLKRSKAEGSADDRWMVITSGWAFAVMAGVFTAIACGSSDAHLNPAVTLGFAVSSGSFLKFCALPRGSGSGRVRGSHPCVDTFPATLEGYGRCHAEAGVFQHDTGYSQLRRKSG